MAVLAEDIKEFIVIALACYDTPQQVADAVKAEFGVVIKRQQVEEYDPVKRRPAQKWKDLYKATRDAFLKDLSTEPASKKSYRVRRLAAMARRAESKGNLPLAADLYEKIAKEMGDAYTNRRIIVPANPLDELARILEMTPEQLAASLDLMDPSASSGTTDGGPDLDAVTASLAGAIADPA
jgi:hypothetical protein